MLRLALLVFTICASQWAAAHGKAATAEESDRFIQFPDVEGGVTLTVDLHTHSVFSDGHVWPNIRVAEAQKDGLDAFAVTEHLEFQPHKADIPHGDRNRAYDEAALAAEGSDLIVIAGAEITREKPAGHINAVFVTDANALISEPVEVPEASEGGYDMIAYYRAAGQWPVENALAAANEQGAFVFWNHPYWTRQTPDGLARISDFHQAMIKAGHLHGVEIANGHTYSEEAHAIALKHNLALIGVSDVHNLVDWDYAPEQGGHRPVTLVLAAARTQDAIKQALFERRTVVWFKNLLIGREPELKAVLDASMEVQPVGWLPDSEVMQIRVVNSSDARFLLQNMGDVTFMEHGDLVEVPEHSEVVLSVKRPTPRETLSLDFQVLNALVAPKQPIALSMEVDVPERQ